jgi:transcriptional regulator with XRE-family HTH domain
MELPFIEAGKFMRQKRKSAGFKTQRALIAALLKENPDINCSEPYISLIEKGAKTPSVHLLDVMARVLKMTPPGKGRIALDLPPCAQRL